MIYRSVFFLIVLFSVNAVFSHNPFRKKIESATHDTTTAISKEKKSDSIKNKIWAKSPFLRESIRLQRKLINALAATMNALSSNKFSTKSILFLLMCLAYGFIHGMGPGHAKTVAFTHSAVFKPSYRAIAKSTLAFSITHAGMAVILFLLVRQFTVAENESHVADTMMVASGILLMAAGALMIFTPLIERLANPSFVMSAAGLVPCPGVLLILGFASVGGIVGYGLVAVVFVSIGMALTVFASSLLGRGVQSVVAIVSSKNTIGKVLTAVRFAGGLFLIFVGFTTLLI